jgi:putative signal transducing protein
MFCPSCGESFSEPVTECLVCGVELTESSPGPPPDPTIQFASVLTTGDPGVIAVAKSLLDAEAIEYLVRAEGLQDLFGWGRLGAGYNILAGPAEFVVREDDAARARELLADLLNPVHRDDKENAKDE